MTNINWICLLSNTPKHSKSHLKNPWVLEMTLYKSFNKSTMSFIGKSLSVSINRFSFLSDLLISSVVLVIMDSTMLSTLRLSTLPTFILLSVILLLFGSVSFLAHQLLHESRLACSHRLHLHLLHHLASLNWEESCTAIAAWTLARSHLVLPHLSLLTHLVSPSLLLHLPFLNHQVSHSLLRLLPQGHFHRLQSNHTFVR